MMLKRYIFVVALLLWAVGMMAQKKGGTQQRNDVQSVTDVQDGTNLLAETAKEKAYVHARSLTCARFCDPMD